MENDTLTLYGFVGPTSVFKCQSAGYFALAASAVLHGIYLLPVKKFNMGDGVGFQWLMSCGVLLVGVIHNVILYFTQGGIIFQPYASLGGLFWALGNAMTVLIIRSIGLSLGLAIWSITSLLLGFFMTRFGAFNNVLVAPAKPIMCYVGVAVAACSIIIYAFVEPFDEEEIEEIYDFTEEDIVEIDLDLVEFEEEEENGGKWPSFFDLPGEVRRALGFLLAFVTGLLYRGAFYFVYLAVIQSERQSSTVLHHIFTHFVGIWLTSSVIFVAYVTAGKNRPWFPGNRAIFASVTSGILWGIAQITWYVAADTLVHMIEINFIVVYLVPLVIATIFGAFAFEEIHGVRNYILHGSATALSVTGFVLIPLSYKAV